MSEAVKNNNKVYAEASQVRPAQTCMVKVSPAHVCAPRRFAFHRAVLFSFACFNTALHRMALSRFASLMVKLSRTASVKFAPLKSNPLRFVPPRYVRYRSDSTIGLAALQRFHASTPSLEPRQMITISHAPSPISRVKQL